MEKLRFNKNFEEEWTEDQKLIFNRTLDFLYHTEGFRPVSSFDVYERMKALKLEEDDPTIVVVGEFNEQSMEGNKDYFVIFRTGMCGFDSKYFRKYGLMPAYRWNVSAALDLNEGGPMDPDYIDYNVDCFGNYTWIYVNPEYSEEELKTMRETNAKLNTEETIKELRW